MSPDEHLPTFESPNPVPVDPPVDPAPVESPTARLRGMVADHYDAVWRTVRFLGIPDAAADDVAQKVFCIAARKLADVAAGKERSFLLSTAWRVASESRRADRRRPAGSGVDVDELETPLPSPEELLDQKRARSALQSVLSAMTPDLRMVFVLFEIEELTLPEIAAATGAPLGTVTSRLRRAREEFQSIVKRRNAAPRPPAREGGP
jgi:RNA polymerase sigma-70 factor (ECF subfamily)